MKKLFYVLCMSVLVFTGCKKSSTPSSVPGTSSREIFKAFCEINPQTDPCPDIAAGTEVTLQDVKPVMKGEVDPNSEILYGAADPAAWDQGFFNVDLNKSIFINFSTEAGSIIPVGTNISIREIQSDLEGPVLRNESSTTATLGGDAQGVYPDSYKGLTMVRVAVFKDLGQYMFLPKLHFAA